MTQSHPGKAPQADIAGAAASIPEAGPGEPGNPDVVLDRAHLSRQTYGNPALETEVLSLFVRQLRGILAAIEDEEADAVLLSHTLLGSARGIGAFALAEAALAVERRAIAGGRDLHLIDRLRNVAEKTMGEISAA